MVAGGGGDAALWMPDAAKPSERRKKNHVAEGWDLDPWIRR